LLEFRRTICSSAHVARSQKFDVIQIAGGVEPRRGECESCERERRNNRQQRPAPDLHFDGAFPPAGAIPGSASCTLQQSDGFACAFAHAISCATTILRSSSAIVPTMRRPLIKNVGVAVSFSASPIAALRSTCVRGSGATAHSPSFAVSRSGSVFAYSSTLSFRFSGVISLWCAKIQS